MKIFKSHLAKLVSIELLFILITYLFFAVIWHTKILPFNVDLMFHIRRINELANDLKRLQLPMFNQYVGMPMGVATLTFYPWLNILPISLLIILHVPPVQAILIGYSFMLFTGLNIAYFTSIKCFKNKLLSLLFAYFYCISTILLCFFYNSMDLGEIGAFFCIPLIFYGWLSWIHDGKWRMMTCGLILVATCHILTLVIVSIFLVTITIMFYKQLTITKIINLGKSFGIFALSTAIIWLPIMILMLSNHITMTTSYQKFGFIKYGGLVPDLIDLIIPSKLSDWTISDVVALVLGIIIWKHLTDTNKKILIYSIIVLIFTLNIPKISPILLFRHTPLIVIQNSVRLALISHMTLTYLFVVEINYIKTHIKKVSVFKILLELLILFTAFYVLVGTAEDDIFLGTHCKSLQGELETHKPVTMYRLNNKSLRDCRVYQAYNFTGSKYDYVPKMIKSLNVDKRVNQLHPNIYQKGHNLYVYGNKSYKSVTIPYVIYNQQNYRFSSKDHNVRIQRNDHIIEVTNIHKGWNHIKVTEPVMYYRWIAIVASIIGISLLIVGVVRNLKSEESEK